MRVLLTGADGFIGSHLATAIAAAGHSLQSLVFGRAARAGELQIDLTRQHALDQLSEPFDAVVHAAGVVDPRISSARTFAVNLGATRSLLRWAHSARVRHFVHISSVAVYGPLLLGEQRSEATPRVGRALGFPYMRSKALAELSVERSGVPYTMLRPPAVVGAGDSVVSPGFHDALSGPGLPLMPQASYRHRVSLALIEGLAQRTVQVLSAAPLSEAVHACDVELALGELAEIYAARLGQPCRFARCSWREALIRKNDVGFAWLAASAGFGQHYSREKQNRLLGVPPTSSLESAVQAGLSGLQGIKRTLF